MARGRREGVTINEARVHGEFFKIQSGFQPLTGIFGGLVVLRVGVASRKTLLSADFVAEKQEETGRVSMHLVCLSLFCAITNYFRVGPPVLHVSWGSVVCWAVKGSRLAMLMENR